MKKVVHIVPVGHTKLTLTEGMRQFPFHKVVLVLGKESNPGEEMAKEVAREIKGDLGGLAETEYLHIDMDDVYLGAIDIAKKIRTEQKEGNEVRVNASGSLRTVGISCYLACAATGASLYVALPSYEGSRIVGIRRVLEIPSFPLKAVGKEEHSILRFLLERGPVDSVDELIQGMNIKGKGSPDYLKERARMSYHIKKLREDGFLETQRRGKNVGITLSRLGELYAVGRG